MKPKTMSLATNEKLKGHVGEALSIQGHSWENSSLPAVFTRGGPAASISLIASLINVLTFLAELLKIVFKKHFRSF